MLSSRLWIPEEGPNEAAEEGGGCLSELPQTPARSKAASLQLKNERAQGKLSLAAPLSSTWKKCQLSC